MHLLSLKARDATSKEVLFRVLHLSEGPNTPSAPPHPTTELKAFRDKVSVDVGNIFRPPTSKNRGLHGYGWNVTRPRQRSLSLIHGSTSLSLSLSLSLLPLCYHLNVINVGALSVPKRLKFLHADQIMRLSSSDLGRRSWEKSESQNTRKYTTHNHPQHQLTCLL